VIRQCVRSLIGAPTFSVVVIVTLALGIGASSAMFSIVYWMLLRPFPYPEPERLVRVTTYPERNPNNEYQVSLADYEDFARRLSGMDVAGLSREGRVNLIVNGRGVPTEVALVTPGLMPTLGVKPVMGAVFGPEDDRPGGNVFQVLISEELWMRAFSADPGIVGKTIRTANGAYTVKGVMPKGFAYPGRTQMWMTVQSELQIRKEARPGERAFRRYVMLARLKPGVSTETFGAEVARVSGEIRREFATANGEVLHRVTTLRDAETKRLRPYLVLLAGAVAVLLLICCANVANLMLARGAARARVYTVHAALGAGRSRLVMMHLVEALALALVGGVLGLGMAAGIVRAFPTMIPESLPAWIRVELDPTVLWFTFGVAVVAALVAGIAPALLESRVNVVDVLKEGTRGSSGRSGWLRQALVVGEVALAMLLLVGAALLVSSFERLMKVDPGFAPEQIVTVSLSPYRPGTNEERIERVCRYYEEVVRRLSEVPGVIAVGGTDNFPYTRQISERSSLNVEAKGDGMGVKAVRAPATFVDVTPGYFDAMGIPVVAGRRFTENDTLKTPWVIILSERAARELFGERNPIGQQVRAGTPGFYDPYATVVGVVGNVKYRAQDDQRTLEFYYPYKQYGLGTAHIAVRAQGDPRQLEAAIRATVQAVDPETAVDEVKTMTGLIEDSLWQQRLWGTILVGFAGVAVFLALIGINGVVSFVVEQRTREIGIRLAIGASPAMVLRSVSMSGLRLVAGGVGLGLVLCWWMTRYVESLLFGVSATEWSVYLGVPLVLAVTGVAASLIPGMRAAMLNPVIALRRE
jgi:putative ABC transport system permease protein